MSLIGRNIFISEEETSLRQIGTRQIGRKIILPCHLSTISFWSEVQNESVNVFPVSIAKLALHLSCVFISLLTSVLTHVNKFTCPIFTHPSLYFDKGLLRISQITVLSCPSRGLLIHRSLRLVPISHIFDFFQRRDCNPRSPLTPPLDPP